MDEAPKKRGRPPKPKTFEAVPVPYGTQTSLAAMWKEMLTHCNKGRGQEAYETWVAFKKVVEENFVKAG